MRLPNSTAWWIHGAAPATGTRDPSWHSGQVSQPRPEPVTRTMEPVTVMPPWKISRSSARIRCTRMVGAHLGRGFIFSTGCCVGAIEVDTEPMITRAGVRARIVKFPVYVAYDTPDTGNFSAPVNDRVQMRDMSTGRR